MDDTHVVSGRLPLLRHGYHSKANYGLHARANAREGLFFLQGAPRRRQPSESGIVPGLVITCLWLLY